MPGGNPGRPVEGAGEIFRGDGHSCQVVSAEEAQIDEIFRLGEAGRQIGRAGIRLDGCSEKTTGWLRSAAG